MWGLLETRTTQCVCVCAPFHCLRTRLRDDGSIIIVYMYMRVSWNGSTQYYSTKKKWMIWEGRPWLRTIFYKLYMDIVISIYIYIHNIYIYIYIYSLKNQLIQSAWFLWPVFEVKDSKHETYPSGWLVIKCSKIGMYYPGVNQHRCGHENDLEMVWVVHIHVGFTGGCLDK